MLLMPFSREEEKKCTLDENNQLAEVSGTSTCKNIMYLMHL